MHFNRVNNLVGWAVFAMAATVYTLTMEPTGSLWDCGEFISSCFKLQIPHPPGAPLFVLLGRLFIILFGDNPMNAAKAVNWLSAMTSAGTILFLFWTITHFARKLVQQPQARLTFKQVFIIMGAGMVGALAYTFSDSFWFSAVEGEVYACSSFFTALVFWAALKWESQADRVGADRWLVFIFFVMGLSIGVHLLNLLTIPAIIMVYYFKRYKTTVRGTIFAFVIGCIVTGFVQKFMIQYTVKGAGWFDIHFVNDLGLPFFIGFAAFFILLTLVMMWSLRLANRKRWHFMRLGIWSMIFMLMGYSTYLTTMIRSNADPAVDIFNVDNPVSLAGYLGREQYGDWPIVYGPDFTDAAPYTDGTPLYMRTKDRYVPAGKLLQQDWAAAPSAHLFPRMWDNDDSRRQAACYRDFTGLDEGEAPTMGDNLKYFARYQTGWMYMRYFMWNFAGRQNDVQGFGNPRDSNWISGISLVDNALYGNQQAMPDSVRTNNKAYNRLFMLPLMLGIAGIFFQYRRGRKDFLVNLLLFFFTGLAIVIYLNQSGYQPRERDYAYVGSFYAFAVWIGLGVLGAKEALQKLIKSPLAAYAAAALCFLAVPVLMARQEWDDHGRSHKTLARDLARNYLESCPPNAILFTFEDNDTYPLWYAQEVEGIRPDVRVVITTLLGTDWLMDQLRYKVNKSAPVNMLFTKEQVAGDRLGAIYYNALPGYDKDKYYDLYSTLKNVVASDDPKNTLPLENGDFVHIFPTRKFSVPVDVSAAQSNGAVNVGDKVVNQLQLDITGNHIFKGDLAMLAIIAGNNWKRPICFTNDQSTDNLGLQKYLRREGMTYRLVPVENAAVNNAVAYRNIMQKFTYGNAIHRGVYFDEENRHRLNTIRLAHADVALSLAGADSRQQAIQVLRQYDKNVREDVLPYGMTSGRGNQHNAISTRFLQACYMAGDKELAKKVHDSVKKDLMQQMSYYRSLGDEKMNDEELVNNAYLIYQGKGGYLSNRQLSFAGDILSCYQLLHQLDELEKQSKQQQHGLLR